MNYTDRTCREFVDITASGAPVPGGGSVAALAGALGASLGAMVAHLTEEKIKDPEDSEELAASIREIHKVKDELLDLVQKDIDNFEPLSKLYSMKSDDPAEKKKIKEAKQAALRNACRGPIEIMIQCGRAIELARDFASKGSKVIVSDAGCSAVLCKAAMQAASLNVYINTNMMKDKELAARINSECAQRLVYYGALADSVFGKTTTTLMSRKTETGETI